MTELELVRELSRRTGLAESATGAVFDTLRSLIRDGAVDRTLLHGRPRAVDPNDPRLVDELIASARAHPRGVEFLLTGSLGAVAITHGVHAFTVEAARAMLHAERTAAEEVEV